MKNVVLVLGLVLVGCAAPVAGEVDAPAALLVSDMYPEMVDAAPAAWFARHGVSCDARAVALRVVDTATLGMLCGTGTAKVTYSACTLLAEHTVLVDAWMQADPDYLRAVVGHELGHWCSYQTTGDGDHDHVEAPSTWDPTNGFAVEIADAGY